MARRIVTVFGATGLQGGSVVNTLLKDGTFTPRAVTRNLGSEASTKLKSRGVEVVQADLNEHTSLDNALAGSEGVFGLIVSPELEPATRLVDAAKRANVKFFVWSSLADTLKISKGKFANIYYCNAKVKQEEYLKKSGVPYALVKIGGFAENLISDYNRLVATSDGTLGFPAYRFTPTATYTITWAGRDTGSAVLALFKNYESRKDEVVGEEFVVASAKVTFPELAGILSEAIGKPVRPIYPDDTGPLGLNDFYDYMVEFSLYGDAPIPDPKLLNLGVKFASLKSLRWKL